MSDEKRCWICGKTVEEIAKIYDLDKKDKKEFWKELTGNWCHEICIVCYDLILSIQFDAAPDAPTCKEDVEEIIGSYISEIIRKYIEEQKHDSRGG